MCRMMRTMHVVACSPGASPDIFSPEGLPSLHLAVYNRHADFVKLLVYKASIHPDTRSVQGPAIFCRTLDHSMAATLVEVGADLDQLNADQLSPLMNMCTEQVRPLPRWADPIEPSHNQTWTLRRAGAQTAPTTSSTAPVHQPLGSANAETTPAGARAAAADRTQRPKAAHEGKNGLLSRKETATRRNVTHRRLRFAIVRNFPQFFAIFYLKRHGNILSNTLKAEPLGCTRFALRQRVLDGALFAHKFASCLLPPPR